MKVTDIYLSGLGVFQPPAVDAGQAARHGEYGPAAYLENRSTAVCVAGDVSPPEMAGETVAATARDPGALSDLCSPCYLDYVLRADPARIRFAAFLAEESGRFFDAQNRCLVIEVEDDFPVRCTQDYHWVTLGQLSELLHHGHYLNVQARSLVACLHSLW